MRFITADENTSADFVDILTTAVNMAVDEVVKMFNGRVEVIVPAEVAFEEHNEAH